MATSVDSYVTARAKYETLSSGQKQRLAVALAMINRPMIVLLDEPTAGLDPQSRRELQKIIRDLRDQGRSILLTTHYIEEAELLCDRVGIIDRGRMIALGTVEDLLAGARTLGSLMRLDLSGNQVGGAGLAALVTAPGLPACSACSRSFSSWSRRSSMGCATGGTEPLAPPSPWISGSSTAIGCQRSGGAATERRPRSLKQCGQTVVVYSSIT